MTFSAYDKKVLVAISALSEAGKNATVANVTTYMRALSASMDLYALEELNEKFNFLSRSKIAQNFARKYIDLTKGFGETTVPRIYLSIKNLENKNLIAVDEWVERDDPNIQRRAKSYGLTILGRRLIEPEAGAEEKPEQ